MCSQPKFLQLSGLLIAIAFPTGCYRTVATIHVNEAQQFVVERSEDATEDDETPITEETEEGFVAWVDDGYRLEVFVSSERGPTRAGIDDSLEGEESTLDPHGIISPSELRLFVDGVLEIDTGNDRYRFTLDHFERVDVNRVRPVLTALVVVGAIILGGGALAGIAIAASMMGSL